MITEDDILSAMAEEGLKHYNPKDVYPVDELLKEIESELR